MNSPPLKQPLKVLEIPLSKFIDEVVPHFQQKYENERILIYKLSNTEKCKELRREIAIIDRSVLQLKDLMYELDSLRQQVQDVDLSNFDTKTLSLRKSIVTMIKGYNTLTKICQETINKLEDENQFCNNPLEGAHHIQIQANINDLKLEEHISKYVQVQAIQNDVEQLHDMFGQLNEMVGHQAENVDNIEECVEDTDKNLKTALKNLQVAQKLKTAAYPMTGAVIGGMIGGPIGMIAGAKVAGLALLCCAFTGYVGGKAFHNINEEVVEDTNKERGNDSVLGDSKKKT